MHVRHLPAHTFQRERWRNGAGWTRSILRAPALGERLDWRASIAEIDRDCSFSAYPGCERRLALLAGDGATLVFADGTRVSLQPPHGRIGFAGEQAPQCVVQGRLQVFNLIAERSRSAVELLHRPLVGPMVFLPEAGVQWLVLLLGGRAELPDVPRAPLLEPGDAVLLWPEAEAPRRLVMSGGGEVLLSRVAARAAE